MTVPPATLEGCHSGLVLDEHTCGYAHVHIWDSCWATEYRLKRCFDSAAELGEQMLSLCVKDHS